MTIIYKNLKSLKNSGKVEKKLIEKNISKSPFYKGVCIKIFIKKPKKPNSANRKVAKVRLSNGLLIIAFIPGISRNLNQRSIVLVKRGKLKDLPGVKYKIIRNKYDCGPVLNRQTSRSKYGKNKSM